MRARRSTAVLVAESLLGLRIHPSTPPSASFHGSAIPYGFDSLLAPIAAHIETLYWAVEGAIVFSAAGRPDFPDDESFLRFFQSELEGGDESLAIWERRWMKPGGLQALATFVHGDWTDIVGVSSDQLQHRSAVNVRDPQWLEARAAVFFACVDAAFWAVFSTNETLLDALRASFPKSQPMELGDRWW